MKTKMLLPFALLVISSIPAMAVNHTIEMIGLTYSPDSITVNVGDTVTWQGNFSFHPLSSTQVPTGAAQFSNSSGTSFSYPVEVEGEYTYRCTNHAPSMSGKFIAVDIATGIEKASGADIRIFPSVTTDFITVMRSGSNADRISIEVFNMGGRLVHETVSLIGNSAKIDLSPFSNGVYFIFIRNEQGILAEKKIVKQ